MSTIRRADPGGAGRWRGWGFPMVSLPLPHCFAPRRNFLDFRHHVCLPAPRARWWASAGRSRAGGSNGSAWQPAPPPASQRRSQGPTEGAGGAGPAATGAATAASAWGPFAGGVMSFAAVVAGHQPRQQQQPPQPQPRQQQPPQPQEPQQQQQPIDADEDVAQELFYQERQQPAPAAVADHCTPALRPLADVSQAAAVGASASGGAEATGGAAAGRSAAKRSHQQRQQDQHQRQQPAVLQASVASNWYAVCLSQHPAAEPQALAYAAELLLDEAAEHCRVTGVWCQPAPFWSSWPSLRSFGWSSSAAVLLQRERQRRAENRIVAPAVDRLLVDRGRKYFGKSRAADRPHQAFATSASTTPGHLGPAARLLLVLSPPVQETPCTAWLPQID